MLECFLGPIAYLSGIGSGPWVVAPLSERDGIHLVHLQVDSMPSMDSRPTPGTVAEGEVGDEQEGNLVRYVQSIHPVDSC